VYKTHFTLHSCVWTSRVKLYNTSKHKMKIADFFFLQFQCVFFMSKDWTFSYLLSFCKLLLLLLGIKITIVRQNTCRYNESITLAKFMYPIFLWVRFWLNYFLKFTVINNFFLSYPSFSDVKFMLHLLFIKTKWICWHNIFRVA
jgi:hypothetical protein